MKSTSIHIMAEVLLLPINAFAKQLIFVLRFWGESVGQYLLNVLKKFYHHKTSDNSHVIMPGHMKRFGHMMCQNWLNLTTIQL